MGSIVNLYDWDGTLVDSFKALFKSYKVAFNEFNLPLSHNEFMSKVSKDSDLYLKNKYNFSNDKIKRLKLIKNNYYLKIANFDLKIKVNPSHFNIISTNTRSDIVERIILNSPSINRSLFKNIFGSNHIKHKKPHPDIFEYSYMSANNQLSNISMIHIYEDSFDGLSAANKFKSNHQKLNIKIHKI